jgi:hypothetical protein
MSEQLRDLKTIEHWMQAVITNPAAVQEAVAAEAAQRHISISHDDLEQVVTRSHSLTAAARLAIYGHAYFARLQECLRAEFPVLLHAIDEELFNLFTFEYLRNYPSRSYTLNQLGENFPRYLAETRPDRDAPPNAREGWPDFIIDLATLERVFSRTFDGPGVEGRQTLDASELFAAGQLAEARFLPVVCLKLLSFRYPVSEYFRAVRNHEDPALPQPAATFLAMTRQNYTVVIHELAGGQYELLKALVAGQTLNAAVNSLTGTTDDNSQTQFTIALSWIEDWVRKGFFAGVELEVRETSSKPAAGELAQT